MIPTLICVQTELFPTMAEDDEDLYLVPPSHSSMTESNEGVSFKDKLKAFQAGQAINNNFPKPGPAVNKSKPPPPSIKPKPKPIIPPPIGGTDNHDTENWRPPLPPARDTPKPNHTDPNKESQRSDCLTVEGNQTPDSNDGDKKRGNSFLFGHTQAQSEIKKHEGGRPPVMASRGALPPTPGNTAQRQTSVTGSLTGSVSCQHGCVGACRCDEPPPVPKTARPGKPFCYGNVQSEKSLTEPDDLPTEIAPPVPSSVPPRPSIPVRTTPGQPLPTPPGPGPQSRPLPTPPRGDTQPTVRPLPRLPSPVELERPLPVVPEPERTPAPTRPTARPLPAPPLPTPEPMIPDRASDWPLPPPIASDWPTPPPDTCDWPLPPVPDPEEETYDIPSQLPHPVIAEDEYEVPPQAVALEPQEPESDDTYDIPSPAACRTAPKRPSVPLPPPIKPEEDETYDVPGFVPVPVIRTADDVFAPLTPLARSQETTAPAPVPPPRPKLSTSLEDVTVNVTNQPVSLKSSKSTDFLLELTSNDERPSIQLLMVERTDKVIEYGGRQYQVVRLVEAGTSETDTGGIAPYDSEEERIDTKKAKGKGGKPGRPPRQAVEDNSGLHNTNHDGSVNGIGGHDNDGDDASIDMLFSFLSDPDVTRRKHLDERFKQDEEKRLEEENLKKQIEKQKLKVEREAERMARRKEREKEKEEQQRLKEEKEKTDREERKAKKRLHILSQLKLENEEAANKILCTVAAIETTAVITKMKLQAERFLTLANCLSVKIGEQVDVIRTDESVNGAGRVLIRKMDGKLGYVERRVLDLPRETDSAQSSGSGVIGASGRPPPPPINTLPGYDEQETYEDIGGTGTGYRSSEEEDLYEDFGG